MNYKSFCSLRAKNERIEFKEAKSDFSFDKLAKYCAALSNEGGGKIILGVTDKKPRLIVGTQAFIDLNRCKLSLTQKLIDKEGTTRSALWYPASIAPQ